MPTPIGHALAGITIAGTAHRRSHGVGLYILAVVLACLPDIDLVVEVLWRGTKIHGGPSHSLSFALLAGLIAASLALGRLSHYRRTTVFAVGFLSAASHGILDMLRPYLYPNYGVQLLWPISDQEFHFSVHLLHHAPAFNEVMTQYGLQLLFRNIQAELLLLGPAVVAVLVWRRWRRQTDTSGRPRRVRTSPTTE